MPTSIPRSTTDRNAPKLFSVASRSPTSDGAGNISTTSVGLKNTPRRPVSFLPKITETEALAYIGLVLIFIFSIIPIFSIFSIYFLFFIFFGWSMDGRKCRIGNLRLHLISQVSFFWFGGIFCGGLGAFWFHQSQRFTKILCCVCGHFSNIITCS